MFLLSLHLSFIHSTFIEFIHTELIDLIGVRHCSQGTKMKGFSHYLLEAHSLVHEKREIQIVYYNTLKQVYC